MAGRTGEAWTFAEQVDFLAAPAFPDASIPMSKLSDTAADLTAQKVTQQRVYTYSWPGNPTTGTYPMAILNNAGTIKSFKLFIGDDPSSGTLTVDLQKCDGVGGALATVLSAALTSTSADTNLTVKSATISSASCASGSVLAAVVTEGVGASGIMAVLVLEEAAAS